MISPQRPDEPQLINHFLTAAAILAALAALAVLLAGWQRGRLHHNGMIADLTIHLGGQQVREHCTTCHPGGAPAGKGNETQGARSHPDITPHAVEKLGCTSCHLGEGMALDETISHGLPGLGARTVLQGMELQASCYTCHELLPLDGAEKAWGGYRLFLKKACDTCHHIAGLSHGGRYGPDLSAVGSNLGLARIEEAIREPKQEPDNSIMPRFPLSRGQVARIAYFLKSRVRDPFYATPMEIQAGRVSLPPLLWEESSGILTRMKCLACHKYQEEDGRIAPDLTFIGSLRSDDYLQTFLGNPSRLIPGAVMPVIPLSPDDKSEILQILEKEAVMPVPLTGAHQDDRGARAIRAEDETTEVPTKHLYMTLCQRCHAAAGDGFGPIQPNLANFPRPFAENAAFFRRISDERIVKSLADGIPGTSMPPYGRLLERPSREALIDLLFSAFIGIERQEKQPLSPIPPSPTAPLSPDRADALFADFCIRCHGIAGTGTGSEYLRYLPRPRNLTNRPYFAALSDERIARTIADGIPGTAMPALREEFSPGDLWALVGKVRSFSGTSKKHE